MEWCNNMVQIRKGRQEDIPAIHQLVVELAIYEKEPDAVTATVEDYYRDFAAGAFDLLVAEEDGEVLGMMLYFMAYSTWKGRMVYLDDFVVREAHRRRGIGRMLYQRFMEEVQEIGAVLAKWQVLDWNQPAIAFYEAQGAEMERGWWNVKRFA